MKKPKKPLSFFFRPTTPAPPRGPRSAPVWPPNETHKKPLSHLFKPSDQKSSNIIQRLQLTPSLNTHSNSRVFALQLLHNQQQKQHFLQPHKNLALSSPDDFLSRFFRLMAVQMEVIVDQPLLTCAEGGLSPSIVTGTSADNLVNAPLISLGQDISGWLAATEVKGKGNSDDQLKVVDAEQGGGDEDNEGGDNGEGDFPDGGEELSPEDGGGHGSNANNSNGNAEKVPGGAGGAGDENGEQEDDEDGDGHNDQDDDKDDENDDDENDDDDDDDEDGEEERDEEDVGEEEPEDEEEPDEEEEALQPPKKRKK